jgi:hypothetical protein
MLVLAMCFTSCRGPDPIVESQHLEVQKDRFVVEAKVRNRARGGAQVEVTATVSDKRSGVTIARGESQVQLSPHETAFVRIDMLRPVDPAIPASDLALVVEAHYPIE